MGASSEQVRGLRRGVVGPARVIAFGTSIVAPAGSVVTLLILVMAYAGFAYTLVNLLPFIAFGWLMLGAVAAAVLRRRRPAAFEALGRAVPSGERERGAGSALYEGQFPGSGDGLAPGADSEFPV